MLARGLTNELFRFGIAGDAAAHGEEAYAFYGDGRRSIVYGDWERRSPSDEEARAGGIDVLKGQESHLHGRDKDNGEIASASDGHGVKKID